MKLPMMDTAPVTELHSPSIPPSSSTKMPLPCILFPLSTSLYPSIL